MKHVLCVLFFLIAPIASADVLIRNAEVHTVDSAGVLKNTDVLIRDGLIAAVGTNLQATAGATIIDAQGRRLTPGLFAGLTQIGLEDVSAEVATVDSAYVPGITVPSPGIQMRPEFDVSLAYNPVSLLVPVARVEGFTFTVLAPQAQPGGSLIAGQGGVVILDGQQTEVLPASRSLFIAMGASYSALTGNSRAAQFMLLEQAVREARGDVALNGFDARLLTASGREVLGRSLRGGRVVFAVDRAIDIRRVLDFAKRIGVKPVISGAVEAWMVADALVAADAAVAIDSLQNLPGNFDQLGASLENAARLHAAGVKVIFSQSGDGSHNARKNRQLAGNAVAHGMPWDAALAALTANPASAFGVMDRGRIAPGLRADLVLWQGDPLDVDGYAEQVFVAGVAQPMTSRQTRLRERYRRD